MHYFLGLAGFFYFFTTTFLFAPKFETYMKFGPLLPDIINEKKVKSLKDLCLGECSLILEKEKLPLKTFNQKYSTLPSPLREEVVNNFFIPFFKNKIKMLYDNAAGTSCEDLFNRSLEGLDPTLYKYVIYYVLFTEDSYYLNKANRDLLCKLLLDKVTVDSSDFQFLNQYSLILAPKDLAWPYTKNPYYIALKQRNFAMLDYLISIGIKCSKTYWYGHGGSHTTVLAILKAETDPNDDEMKNYLSQKLGISFDKEDS